MKKHFLFVDNKWLEMKARVSIEGYKGFLDFKQAIKKKKPQCGNIVTYISWIFFLLQTNTKQR